MLPPKATICLLSHHLFALFSVTPAAILPIRARPTGICHPRIPLTRLWHGLCSEFRNIETKKEGT